MDAAVLTRLTLDGFVQLDGVLLQLRHVGVAVERVHAAGGMPRGSGGELFALEQNYVGPAGLGEMVKNAGTDDAAADHDDLS